MRARDPANSRKTEMADSWPVCPFLKLEAACISWENDNQIWKFISILICAVVTETDKSWKRFKGHEYWDPWTVLVKYLSVHIKTIDSSPTLLIITVGMLEACKKMTTEMGVTGDRRRPNRPKYTTKRKIPGSGKKKRSQVTFEQWHDWIQ